VARTTTWSTTGASRVLAAVPVGPTGQAERLAPVVDQVVVLVTPDPYLNVGQAYERFAQIDDDEVLRCLEAGRTPTPR
jgi:putative phosphoribosyl transferase